MGSRDIDMGLSNGETRRQLADGLVYRDCRLCLTRPPEAGFADCECCGGTGIVIIRAPDVDPWRTHDPR